MSGTVTACQGPPRCRLEGDDAIEAQKAGCPWCRRFDVADDGSETAYEPPLLSEQGAQQ